MKQIRFPLTGRMTNALRQPQKLGMLGAMSACPMLLCRARRYPRPWLSLKDAD
jgi:hypothetical protein